MLCIGNAIVDVFAPDKGYLISSKYGIEDPVQHVDITKLKALKNELNDYTQVSGGGSANAAKIAGFMGIRTCFIGSIGEDEEGEFFERSLAESGVELLLKKAGLPTGLCLYLEGGEGRTRIAASPSAAIELSLQDICEEAIAKASIVLIDGFMLMRPGLVETCIELAEKNGIICAIDLSSKEIAERYAPEILEKTENELILFMNEDEAAVFEGKIKSSSLLSLTKERPLLKITVKLGPKGSIVYSEGESFFAETKAIIPKNTVGAGDAFCGAFLSGLLRGKSLYDSAALANRAAGMVLGVYGTGINALYNGGESLWL
ncbi:MAG: PfkB family carbohydrate kinase [Treponema sp.]|nr:PfkB family carbohydrate kinase [Treponema sp.]